jgi:hypothetical protein
MLQRFIGVLVLQVVALVGTMTNEGVSATIYSAVILILGGMLILLNRD